MSPISKGNKTSMSDDKKILSRPSGTVKQQFARGKIVAVSVETKKKATSGLLNIKKSGAPRSTVAKPKTAATLESGALVGKTTTAAPPPSAPSPQSENQGLSSAEREARLKALARAQQGKVERELELRQLEEQRRVREKAQATREAEERAREETKRASEEENVERAVQGEETHNKLQEQAAVRTGGDPLVGGRLKSKRSDPQPTRQQLKKGGDQRRKGRLTIAEALAGDEERQRSIASVKRRARKGKSQVTGGFGSRSKNCPRSHNPRNYNCCRIGQSHGRETSQRH